MNAKRGVLVLIRRTPILGRVSLCRVLLGRVLLGTVMVVMSIAIGSRAGAQSSTSTPDPDLAERIQILSVEETIDETGANIILELAVPPAIGRLDPIDANFGVTDGGQLVDVAVAPIGTAADTVVVLDTSGSMRGSALAAAKTAAGSFVQELPEDARVGLISFGDEVEIHQAPTLDRAAVLSDLNRLEATGDATVLWDALTVAAEMISDASELEHSSIVVLSDGEDTNSTAEPADVVRQLGAGSSVLYAVAIESPDTNLVALERTVDLVGGQFLETTSIGQLDSLYADIAGRLANRYELRFAAAQQGQRTVVVSVATDAGVATALVTVGEGTGGTSPEPDGTIDGPPPVLNTDDQLVLGPVAATAPGRLADPTMLWIGLGSMFLAFLVVALIIARPKAAVRFNAAAGADRIGGINARLGQSVDRLISNHDRGRRIDGRLEAADIDLRPGEFVLAWLLATAGVCITSAALLGLAMASLVVPISAVAAMLILSARASRRRSRFADQLTETLGILASSLRAGQGLPRSIELVASEASSPTAEQFHRISFEVRVGRDLTESIRDAAKRMDSPDLEWLAQAVDINRELGGDLTEILDNVATTIRERRTVARQIDALSAEGRATGWVLLSLPVVLFLFTWWRTPSSIEALVTEPIGRVLLAFAASGMAVGHLWIRHLVKLKF